MRGNPDRFALVSSNLYYSEIHRELTAEGTPHCGVDAFVIRRHKALFEEVSRLLDEESRRVYAGILLARLTHGPSDILPLCTENQYFCLPEFRYLGEHDVFVDCGAFAGDSMEEAIEKSRGMLRRVYAFEPSRQSCAALRRRAQFLREIWGFSEDRIVCEQKGIGRETAQMYFRDETVYPTNLSLTAETSEALEQTSDRVEIVSLDDYFSRQKGERPTFLKADIEGFEWDMLHGAEKLICRDKPKLAICIYHNIYDFFRIPLYLRSLVPEYRFAVRHHWYGYPETVLYCCL